MERAFVGLGTNLGQREAFLAFALQQIDLLAVSGTLRCSPWYETAAVGGPDQPDYLNGVICFDTSLSPPALLLQLQHIEQQAGRERTVVWGPRTLDLDLLWLGAQVGVWNDPPLILPHPRLHLRRFVLQPLAALAAHAQHPTLLKEIKELLHDCLDPSSVRLYIPQAELASHPLITPQMQMTCHPLLSPQMPVYPHPSTTSPEAPATTALHQEPQVAKKTSPLFGNKETF